MAATALQHPLVEDAKAREKLSQEGLQRLSDCKQEKNSVRTDIEECYYFSSPRRKRSASSSNSADTSSNRPADKFELQTSLGFEVADDFAGMLISAFTPAEAPWAERKPDPSGEDEAADAQTTNEAQKADAKIFRLIRASNYYAEKGKTAVPDAAIGVIAMLIHDRPAGLPVVCQGIPIREIEMALGPDGRIDDRWIIRTTKYRHVRAQLPGVQFDEETTKKIKDSANEPVQLKWGWWRNWENVGDEEWVNVVYVGEKLVHSGSLVGQGSCPFVIGRFGATPDFAWPDGPMIKALPDLRNLDEMCAAFVENMDFTLRPPKAYEDDGVLNLEGGIEPGMAYPKRPNGGRPVFENIYEPNPLEAALFNKQELIQHIRRLHYVDFPEQKGKTPPSATQWLDEMVLRQQRIGTPGYSYWREEPYETFQRFRYIAEKRGIVEPIITASGAHLQPLNPAERAHENQKALTTMRFLQFVVPIFPQTSQVAIDDVQTMKNIQKNMGEENVVFRTPEKVKEAVGLVAQFAPGFGSKLGGGLPTNSGSENV